MSLTISSQAHFSNWHTTIHLSWESGYGAKVHRSHPSSDTTHKPTSVYFGDFTVAALLVGVSGGGGGVLRGWGPLWFLGVFFLVLPSVVCLAGRGTETWNENLVVWFGGCVVEEGVISRARQLGGEQARLGEIFPQRAATGGQTSEMSCVLCRRRGCSAPG